MAKIGLKYPVACEHGASKTGFVIAKAVQADITINSNSTKLYADDAVAEADNSFKDGTVALTIDELSQTVQCTLLGHTEDENQSMVASLNDIAPYVKFGFYGAKIKDNVRMYRAVCLQKVKFSEPTDTNKTRGESTEFATQLINGTILTDDNGVWKIEKTFTTEAEAKEWLNTQVNITE